MEFSEARRILEQSGVIGLPTETVYGLAARIDRPEGIRAIFTTKERPFFDPLIVHIASVEAARTLAREWGPATDVLARAFWPGPLTLVVPKSSLVDTVITSGLETVGLRVPNHPVALELLRQVGVPLAAPSANRFGRTSPTTPAHVRAEFGDRVRVLDGGACEVGIESTIVKVDESPGTEAVLTILRPGRLTPAVLSAALDAAKVPHRWQAVTEKRLAPGQMKHHYMPEIPLVLVEGPDDGRDLALVTAEANRRIHQLPDEVEGVRLKKPAGDLARAVRLELSSEPAVAARELYAKLRELATSGADHLVLFLDPARHSSENAGLLDRVRKAASLILS